MSRVWMLLILFLMCILVASPFAGLWLAAHANSFFMFPVPTLVCLGFLALCLERLERTV